jgi:maleate cis-trans isomerase
MSRTTTPSIALVVPGRNTEAERQLHSILGAFGVVNTERCATRPELERWRCTEDIHAMAEANRQFECEAIERLRVIEPDVLVIGETHALLQIDQVKSYLSERRRLLDVPCVFWVDAYVAAFERLGGIRAIGVLTPFSVDVSDLPQVESWQVRDVDVCAIRGFGCSDARGIAAVTSDQIMAAGHDCVSEGADAVVALCTNFNCMISLEWLEDGLGVPVLPVNAVLAWQCLRVLGVPERPAGFGSILSIE